MDDSNHTLSVEDEHEAGKVYDSFYQLPIQAGNVWADVSRNAFLDSVTDPPIELTPGPNMILHKAIKWTHHAVLKELVKPPEKEKDQLLEGG